jgi:hypothetical protein
VTRTTSWALVLAAMAVMILVLIRVAMLPVATTLAAPPRRGVPRAVTRESIAQIAMTAVAAIGLVSGTAARRRSDSRKKVATAGIMAMIAAGAVLAFVAVVSGGF